jgi:hypothetical protein
LLLLQTSVAAPTCALRCHGRSGSPSLSRLSFSASRFSGDIVYELASPSRANARGLDLLRCWLRIMVQLTDPQFWRRLQYTRQSEYRRRRERCEHVIGVATSIAEAVLRSAPRVRILATSREPLRAEGEWSHRLASLHPPVPVDVELAARFPRRITDGSGFIGWPSRAVSLATNASFHAISGEMPSPSAAES